MNYNVYSDALEIKAKSFHQKQLTGIDGVPAHNKVTITGSENINKPWNFQRDSFVRIIDQVAF